MLFKSGFLESADSGFYHFEAADISLFSFPFFVFMFIDKSGNLAYDSSIIVAGSNPAFRPF